MVFTTYHFLFWFLPLCLLGYFVCLRTRVSWLPALWLTLASYVFYGWERPDFLALIFTSTCLDFCCGKVVANNESPHRKKALTLSIMGNLGLLGYFKYHDFGIEAVNSALGWFDVGGFEYAHVALPVGISFYTFQTMSYTIDIYRGEVKPGDSFAHVACYVALFPQLVAGPIVRYRDLADQLRARTHTWEKFGRGALIFMCGFAKKILIADSASRLVVVAFEGGPGSAENAWVGILAYTVQIYFDFSGYSDMAIGLGRMFGFEFPLNFLSPYRSRSITEFWRRWHVSLSTWLRDYLYIPLGGGRGSTLKVYRNLCLTMLLGGLWHGAQWTFVIWGAYHGALLALERALGKKSFWHALPGPLQVIPTLVTVMIGWVFFRAATIGDAAEFLGAMAFMSDGSAASLIASAEKVDLVLTALGVVLFWAGIQSDKLVERPSAFGRLIATIFLMAVFVVAVGHMFFQSYSPFLYFQF